MFENHVFQIVFSLKEDHKLNYQVCFPSSFDRQKVSLVDKLFHTSTIAAMRVAHCSDTANFMQIVRNWFTCMNVKNFALSSRKRLELAKPLYRGTWEQSETTKFLREFLSWLRRWNDDDSISSGEKLSGQTYQALSQSVDSFLNLVPYLFDQYPQIDYILSAKFQSDVLEQAFGTLRRFSGNCYKLSMVQVEENLKKMRIRSILSHCKRTGTELSEYMKQHVDSIVVDEANQLSDECIAEFADIFEIECELHKEVTDSCIKYVAGACAKKVPGL